MYTIQITMISGTMLNIDVNDTIVVCTVSNSTVKSISRTVVGIGTDPMDEVQPVVTDNFLLESNVKRKKNQ